MRTAALLALGCAAGAAGALWWFVTSRDKAGAPDASPAAEPTRAARAGPLRVSHVPHRESGTRRPRNSRPKRQWRAERMRQGPGRGDRKSASPADLADLESKAQALRAWLRQKKEERGRRVRSSRTSALPPPVPPARRFCAELRQERQPPDCGFGRHVAEDLNDNDEAVQIAKTLSALEAHPQAQAAASETARRQRPQRRAPAFAGRLAPGEALAVTTRTDHAPAGGASSAPSWEGQVFVRLNQAALAKMVTQADGSRVRTGATKTLEVSSADTVGRVKQQLQQLQGACAAERLLFAGKELPDDATLAECGVSRENTLDALPRCVGGGGGAAPVAAASSGTDAREARGKWGMLPDVLQGVFGGIGLFARSLEARLGGMNDNAVAGLYAEHVMAASADTPFTPQNHPTAGRPTTPKHEFRAVVGENGVDTTTWTLRPEAEPTCDADARVPGRVLKSIACFMKCEQARRAGLTHGELVALRLFTGPMYVKYNEVLRATTLQESAAQPAESLEAKVTVPEGAPTLEANTYSTTIGLLISGLVKLGRIASLPRGARGQAVAYRGLAGLDLPSAVFTPDEQGFCGVVEPALLSMSDDAATALRYSGLADGKQATIFELELGKASLGAEVAWLSQFPHERERILPPWTHLEVLGPPTQRADGVTIVQMKPTVFQNVRTVEEVAGAR